MAFHRTSESRYSYCTVFCNKMQKVNAVQWFAPPRRKFLATQDSHEATVRRGSSTSLSFCPLVVPSTARQLLPHTLGPWRGFSLLYEYLVYGFSVSVPHQPQLFTVGYNSYML